jgi:tellurite resistance protein
MNMGYHAALIYSMIIASGADRDISERELGTIGEIVRHLPIFRDFDPGDLPEIARSCANHMQEPDGLDTTLELIRDNLPDALRETAYAVACDVVASDRHGSQEERRILDLLRYQFGIGRLAAAAIERGARARYMTMRR